jgi:hypothetical protein
MRVVPLRILLLAGLLQLIALVARADLDAD